MVRSLRQIIKHPDQGNLPHWLDNDMYVARRLPQTTTTTSRSDRRLTPELNRPVPTTLQTAKVMTSPPPQELPHSVYYKNEQDLVENHDPDAWKRVKPYPAGYRRHPVAFVPADQTQSTFPSSTRPHTPSSGADVAARYLRLVGIAAPVASPAPAENCASCGQPILAGHELTLAHQASLEHSFPPHHHRRGVGLKILEEKGWDPDERKGLGKELQGERYPVKAVEKKDRRGLGAAKRKPTAGAAAVEKTKERLHAKAVRKREVEGRERREKIMGELRGGVDWGVMMGGEETKGLR